MKMFMLTVEVALSKELKSSWHHESVTGKEM